MTHLSLSQSFLVLVSKPVVSLQPASPLSPPPQHSAYLQLAIVLTLRWLALHGQACIDIHAHMADTLTPYFYFILFYWKIQQKLALYIIP